MSWKENKTRPCSRRPRNCSSGFKRAVSTGRSDLHTLRSSPPRSAVLHSSTGLHQLFSTLLSLFPLQGLLKAFLFAHGAQQRGLLRPQLKSSCGCLSYLLISHTPALGQPVASMTLFSLSLTPAPRILFSLLAYHTPSSNPLLSSQNTHSEFISPLILHVA